MDKISEEEQKVPIEADATNESRRSMHNQLNLNNAQNIKKPYKTSGETSPVSRNN